LLPFTTTADGKNAIVNENVVRHQIVHGTGDERALAIDVLINVASRTDEDGEKAQAILLDLHERPNAGNPRQDQEIRTQLKEAARSMCRLVIENPKRDDKGREADPLSMAVAYLGGKCSTSGKGEARTGGEASRRRDAVGAERIQAFMRDRLASARAGLSGNDKSLLDSARCVDEAELMKAAERLWPNLPVHSEPLGMCMSGEHADEFRAFMFFGRLGDALKKLDGENAPRLQAAWIQTGRNGYAHWMPLLLYKREDGNIHFHVVDSNSSAGSGREVRKTVQRLLREARVPDDRIHVHAGDLQINAPNGCGPLGHRLLEALDRAHDQFADGRGNVSNFIRKHMDQWLGRSPAEQQAAMERTRAELLAGWETAQQPKGRAPEHRAALTGARAAAGDAGGVSFPGTQVARAERPTGLSGANPRSVATPQPKAIGEAERERARREVLFKDMLANVPSLSALWRALFTAGEEALHEDFHREIEALPSSMAQVKSALQGMLPEAHEHEVAAEVRSIRDQALEAFRGLSWDDSVNAIRALVSPVLDAVEQGKPEEEIDAVARQAGEELSKAKDRLRFVRAELEAGCKAIDTAIHDLERMGDARGARESIEHLRAFKEAVLDSRGPLRKLADFVQLAKDDPQGVANAAADHFMREEVARSPA
jgi:hypothetical protein